MEKILLTVEHWWKWITQNSTSIHDKNSMHPKANALQQKKPLQWKAHAV